MTVSDPDNTTLTSATISIASGFLAGDLLSANVLGTTITQSYNSGTGLLTLSGSDTLAHYQQVLRSVAYSSSSSNPTNNLTDLTRTINWQVSDGTNSTIQTETVNVLEILTILSGTTLNIGNISAPVASLVQSGGTLTGSGIVMVSGAMTWSGGNETGAGQTIVQGNATFTNQVGIDDGRVVELHGTNSTLAANASINLNPTSTGNAAAGVLWNVSGATFSFTGDGNSIFTPNFGRARQWRLGTF